LEDGGRRLFLAKNPPISLKRQTIVRKHFVMKDSYSFLVNNESVAFRGRGFPSTSPLLLFKNLS